MSESGNPTRKDNASTVVTLTITLDQLTGMVNVNGPLQNPLLCYGLLEAAKDSIRAYVQQNQSPIVKPNLGLRM